jgi:hypothetical protein
MMNYKLKENKIVKFLLLTSNTELQKQLITLPQPSKPLLILEKKLETSKLLLAITKHKIKFSLKDYQLSMLTELLMPLLLPQELKNLKKL